MKQRHEATAAPAVQQLPGLYYFPPLKPQVNSSKMALSLSTPLSTHCFCFIKLWLLWLLSLLLRCRLGLLRRRPQSRVLHKLQHLLWLLTRDTEFHLLAIICHTPSSSSSSISEVR